MLAGVRRAATRLGSSVAKAAAAGKLPAASKFQKVKKGELRVWTQFLGIWLEDWFVGNCYAPPDAAHRYEDPRQELSEFFEEALMEGSVDGRWLLMGYFNEEPGKGLSELFEAHRGHVMGVGRSTGWDGNREVDWFVANSFAAVARPAWEEVQCRSLITF